MRSGLVLERLLVKLGGGQVVIDDRGFQPGVRHRAEETHARWGHLKGSGEARRVVEDRGAVALDDAGAGAVEFFLKFFARKGSRVNFFFSLSSLFLSLSPGTDQDSLSRLGLERLGDRIEVALVGVD